MQQPPYRTREDVRGLSDGTLEPAPPPTWYVVPDASVRRPRREPAVLVLATAAVLTCVALGVGLWLQQSPDEQTVQDAAGQSAAGPDAATGDVPALARTPGGYVRTRVGAAGRLVTDQWLVSEQPVRELTLRPRAVDDITGAVPRIRRLEVTADGDPVPTASDPRSESARTGLRVNFDDAVTTVHLRYATRGGVVRSEPSTSGRALVVANPVSVVTDSAAGSTASDPDELGVVRLAGAGVLSLSCASAQQLPEPCGRPDGTGWRVQLATGDRTATVLAQVDLPTA